MHIQAHIPLYTHTYTKTQNCPNYPERMRPTEFEHNLNIRSYPERMRPIEFEHNLNILNIKVHIVPLYVYVCSYNSKLL